MSKIIEHTNGDKKFLLVDVPENFQDAEIQFFQYPSISIYTTVGQSTIELHENHIYTLLGRANDLSEALIIKYEIVEIDHAYYSGDEDNWILSGGGKFCDYCECDDYDLDSAKESLHSLIERYGLNNPVVLQID